MVQRMAATLKERDCDLSGPLGSSPRLRRVPQIFPLYGRVTLATRGVRSRSDFEHWGLTLARKPTKY